MNTKASVTSEAVAVANEGQKRQIARMLQDAIPLMVEKADMSFDEAQRMIRRFFKEGYPHNIVDNPLFLFLISNN